jgi:hypothetical protein
MSNVISILGVAAGAVLLLAGDRASAQFPAGPGGPIGPPAPTSRPAFSPYLNLTRNGTSPAINYFGLVRPQMAAQQSFQSLQQQIGGIRQAEVQALGAVNPELPLTGQPVYFLNTGGYFLNQRTGPAQSYRNTTQSFRLAPPAAPATPAPGRTR